MVEKRFLQGFVVALIALGLVVLGLQLLLTRAGEIGLAGIVDRQLAAPNGTIFFQSGVNQNAFLYKLMLLDRTRPAVVAIGSSRAMEVRSENFNTSFLTLGGAVNNLANLEAIAAHLSASPAPQPGLALVFVDPWLFNARYTDNRDPVPTFPKLVSADMLWSGAKALRHGNWVAQTFSSRHLGINAILRNEGYARDGSQYYNLTGGGLSYDLRFATTFARIDGDHRNFQRGDSADPLLLQRICRAVARIGSATGHVVLIAPPFATPIWGRLSRGGYGYIADGYAQLQQCLGNVPFFNFADPATIPSSSDCEFVDGLHGGDVTYARLLGQIADADPVARRFLRRDAIRQFTQRYRGKAGGAMLALHPEMKEIDFLGIGCRK